MESRTTQSRYKLISATRHSEAWVSGRSTPPTRIAGMRLCRGSSAAQLLMWYCCNNTKSALTSGLQRRAERRRALDGGRTLLWPTRPLQIKLLEARAYFVIAVLGCIRALVSSRMAFSIGFRPVGLAPYCGAAYTFAAFGCMIAKGCPMRISPSWPKRPRCLARYRDLGCSEATGI